MSRCVTKPAVFVSKLSGNILLKEKLFFLNLHGADYRVVSHGPGKGAFCWYNKACHSPFQPKLHSHLFCQIFFSKPLK